MVSLGKAENTHDGVVFRIEGRGAGHPLLNIGAYKHQHSDWLASPDKSGFSRDLGRIHRKSVWIIDRQVITREPVRLKARSNRRPAKTQRQLWAISP